MINLLANVFKSYKLYIYAALAAIVISGWVWDRNVQYAEGRKECEQAQADAQAAYWEQRSVRLAAEAKEALKLEQATSKTITTRQNNRAAEVEKSVQLSKQNPSGGCMLSDDELLDIEAAIREANS